MDSELETASLPLSRGRSGARHWATLVGLFVVSGLSVYVVSHSGNLGFLFLVLLATAGWVGAALGVRYLPALFTSASARKVLIPFLEDRDQTLFLTRRDGTLVHFSKGAQDSFPSAVAEQSLSLALGYTYASAEELVSEVSSDLRTQPRIRRDIPLLAGNLNLTVSRVGGRYLLWEFETQILAQASEQPGEKTRIPMMTAQEDGQILFMNSAARGLLGESRTHLSDVIAVPGTNAGDAVTVTAREGECQCLVAEYETDSGMREIYLLQTEVPTVRDGAVQFDELPVALLKIRVDGSVELANNAARILLNCKDVSNVVVSDLMEGLGRSIRDWMSEAATGLGVNQTEFLRLKREDKEVYVQVSLNRVVEGGAPSLIAVLSDATELKTLEAQFVQSQKMQAIGQLAGGVAHDFNNLLTAISGHCDLLLLRHDQGDPDFGDLVQINQNANRAAALVGQLLAFSRKQNLRPEVLDLRNTLADLTHLLNRLVGERVSLVLNNDPVLPSIRADKRQLEQVLMNLVVNARDAMPDGGEIRIQTEDIELTEPLERDRVVVATGRYVSVRVSDDGIGIPSDKLQKVFEPFFTTKRTGEGTGLGLSTAYGIVKQTGGYIFVDSTLGVGTVFTLMFPVHEQTILVTDDSVVEHPKVPAVDDQDGVILLVEDEAPVRSFASRALRLKGLTVLEAASGEEALEILAGEDAPHIDLFLTDVIMPNLDGPSWVRVARETYPTIPVIFVSGYAKDSFADDQARI
nr:ATP-binding protein [Shimia abyssi]